MSDLIDVLHVMAGAFWFGGQVYVEGLMASAARTKDPATIMTVAVRVGATSQRLFLGAGILVLITGPWMVIDHGAFTFDMAFISIGFAVAVFTIALNLFYLKPRDEEVQQLVAEHGLTSPEAMAKAREVGNISHVATLLLTIALIVMVLKPGL